MNVQEATAKALLVDAEALARPQQAGDVLGANAVLMDAYNTDVRPLLAELRAEHGPGPRPDRRLPPLRLLRAHHRRPDRRHAAGWGRLGRLDRTATHWQQEATMPAATRRTNCSPAATGWAPTRATPTTPAATPPPRAATDPVTGDHASCCGSRAPAATSAR